MQRALGRNMGTVLHAASNIGGSIRGYSERKRLEEEEGKGGINVPISQAFPRRAIGGESLGEAIDTRKREIRTEQAATAETYEANKAAAEVEAGQKKIVIDNLPEVQQMKQEVPTAYEMMYDMARLSGFLENVHGVETITADNLEKLRLQIGKNREWRRDFNVAGLEDMASKVNKIRQAMTEDPKNAETLAPELGKHQAKLTAQTNLVATEDEEVRRWKAKQKPATSKPDEWQAWGHGQMRNKRTGEIKDVNIKPVKDSGAGTFNLEKEYRQTRQAAERNALTQIFTNDPTVMDKLEEWKREVNPERQAMIMAGIHREMTESQKGRFFSLIDEYMKRSPEAIYTEHQRIMTAPRNVSSAQGTLDDFWTGR